MNVEIQKLTWHDAYSGYDEVRHALRNHPEAKHLKIASRAYFHMKKGRGVLDAYTAIKKAGLNADGEPKLALAPSNLLKGLFEKNYSDGGGNYCSPSTRWSTGNAFLTIPKDTFPIWPRDEKDKYSVKRKIISSPCPTIPPKMMPKSRLENYFTMWEVEHWNLEPPVDPILLQRISKNLFIVLGSWDTTPLERSILRGMYS